MDKCSQLELSCVKTRIELRYDTKREFNVDCTTICPIHTADADATQLSS